MPAGVLQRAQDERLLELPLQPLADRALAARERLRELAIERLLPVAVAVAAGARRRSRTSGGRSATSMRWPGAITVSQWQMFSSWRTLPGNGNADSTLSARFGEYLRLDREFARALLQEMPRQRRDVLAAARAAAAGAGGRR